MPLNKQLDKKELAKGVVSTIVVESQHLDPGRVIDTVDTLISSRDLIVKREGKGSKKAEKR